MSKTEILNKLDDILDNARVNELLGRKKEEEKRKIKDKKVRRESVEKKKPEKK